MFLEQSLKIPRFSTGSYQWLHPLRATIDFNVSFIELAFKHPVISMYMVYPAIGVDKGCSDIDDRYVLHEHLDPGRNDSSATCRSSKSGTVNCKGRVTVQDYIPRNFSLSFGFDCHWSRIHSLKGLRYNISFSIHSNKTNHCVFWVLTSPTRNTRKCAEGFISKHLFQICLDMSGWIKYWES